MPGQWSLKGALRVQNRTAIFVVCVAAALCASGLLFWHAHLPKKSGREAVLRPRSHARMALEGTQPAATPRGPAGCGLFGRTPGSGMPSRTRAAAVRGPSGDGAARLERELRVGAVLQVAFSPDGTLLAVVACEDGSSRTVLKIIDRATGRTVKRLTGASSAGHVLSLAGGRTFAAVVNGCTSRASPDRIAYWDWTTLRRERVTEVPPGPKGRRDVLAISPDGRRAVIANQDGRLCIWAVDASARIADLPVIAQGSQPEVPGSVAFSPDGRYVAMSTALAGAAPPRGGPHEYLLYDSCAQGCVLRRSFATDRPFGVTFSPDGLTLAVGLGGSAQLHRVRDGRAVGRLEWEHEPRQVAFSPDGSLLAVSGGRAIALWDVRLRKWRKQWSARRYTDAISSLVFSPDSATLAVGEVADPDMGPSILGLWRTAVM